MKQIEDILKELYKLQSDFKTEAYREANKNGYNARYDDLMKKADITLSCIVALTTIL